MRAYLSPLSKADPQLEPFRAGAGRPKDRPLHVLPLADIALALKFLSP